MPQLIALTSLYAQCEQGGYLLLPIFAKMTIFGIFRDFREFPDPPQIFGIFGDFSPKSRIFPQNPGFFGIFGIFWGFWPKSGPPPGGWLLGPFFPKIGHCGTNGNRFFVLSGFFLKLTDLYNVWEKTLD